MHPGRTTNRSVFDQLLQLSAFVIALLGAASAIAGDSTGSGQPLWDRVEHGYANNAGVKIHYATTGKGPLVVMIHGFPDFWYSWRHQMDALSSDYQVVAIDQRGYNKSDAPAGDENYSMRYLTSDVAAVIKALGQDKAIIVGHDWGGSVAWNFAFAKPAMVDKLIVLNLPHPKGLAAALANNPQAQANASYAQKFRLGKPTDPDIMFGGPMNTNTLSGWVTDPAAKKRYQQAFKRSNFDAMLAYYKRNYPPPAKPGAEPPQTPQLNVPTLMFHGLEDNALPSDGLNNTWDWIDADLTIVSAPGAGHFVQQDAAELVSDTMLWWLRARTNKTEK